MTQTYLDPQGTPQPDRRQHRHLREIFDGFRAIVEPFVRDNPAWGGGDLSYLARRQIQESYPQLDAHEINILIHAVSRVVHEERQTAA
jgi:hypothetical protein